MNVVHPSPSMSSAHTSGGFRGVFPYLATPLDNDGDIACGTLARLTEDLVAAGVHGLTPLGSTGEYAYLSWPQKELVVQTVLDAAAGRVPVVAGVAATGTAEAVRQTRRLDAMGVSGIVAMLETYFPLPTEAIADYFRAIAQATSLPIVLYSNPALQGFEVGPPVLEQLQTSANIRYLKDASGHTGRLMTIMRRFDDRFHIFSASAHVPAAVMLMGGVGWMAGPACLIPRQSVQLYEHCMNGDWAGAMALQRRLWRLNELFVGHNLAACIKAGLEIRGYHAGEPVPPQPSLPEAVRTELRSLLQSLPMSSDGEAP